jgi:hypothetical protein
MLLTPWQHPWHGLRSIVKMTGTLPKPCKRPDSMLLVITGEMCMSQPHRDVFMVHQFFHRWEVHSSHHQTARKGVPYIMDVKCASPAFAQPVRMLSTRSGREYLYRHRRPPLSASLFILTAFSVVVNTSFIGTRRLSPFFVHVACLVIVCCGSTHLPLLRCGRTGEAQP